MKVCEIYESLQGEGFLVGTPSIFIRTSGCNLRCWFCDTPFASWQPEGVSLDISQIVNESNRFTPDHVVITGGEPMLWKELTGLTERLKELGKHITIETAGTIEQSVRCDLMSLSPKLSNSRPQNQRWEARHERTRTQLDVVRRLIDHHPYQLKFVVDSQSDLLEIDTYLEQIPAISPNRVLLMPQGLTVEEVDSRALWLKEACDRRGFHYCDRMHLRWFGNRRGT